nr:camp-dependent protein kinase regulatory subunit [Quercus suber]
MYNAPRAATVVSTESSILWCLDRMTFRRILMDSAFQRRRMYESFLEEVELLASLTTYERSKIADALETTKYPAGSFIIREGDVGDKFYILEAGEAEALKRGSDAALKSYKKGDYFGELALLDDKPRAASVRSVTETKVATLGKDGFQRLLGPVESIMRRDDPRNKNDAGSADPLRSYHVALPFLHLVDVAVAAAAHLGSSDFIRRSMATSTAILPRGPWRCSWGPLQLVRLESFGLWPCSFRVYCLRVEKAQHQRSEEENRDTGVLGSFSTFAASLERG